jgi:hypothetical protein
MSSTFSASTCINSIVTSQGPFNIYLNSNYGSSPFSSATLNDLTNCPFVIVVPTGTTSLGFKDIILNYCLDMPIQNNDICSNCNLGLSNYSASTISKVYCGFLTGSCEFSDYLINWYGPNDTTTLSFQSGTGSFITSGVYQHPFSTESTSIPRESGVYTPVITKIKLSGITFSNTGGTNTVLFDGNCLPSTNVLPLTCSVVTNPTTNNYIYSAYTNFLSFDSNTQGTPLPISTTYQISASTKYIVWAFNGDNNPDRITIEFSGSSYGTNKIGLEDFIIGGDLTSSNFSASTYPKSADTNIYFVKYTCLTGLTVNNDDKIIINITPATSSTKWGMYISCLDDYECNDCISTQQYKIIGSSITGKTQSCNITKVEFSISGCSYPNNSSDYMSYYLPTTTGVNTIALLPLSNIASFNSNLINFSTPNLFYTNINCNNSGFAAISSNCSVDTTPTKYSKSFLMDGRGVFGFTGSSTFISTYYNSINNSFLGLPPYSSVWTGSTNSNNINYYRYYFLKIPSQTTPVSCEGNVFTTIYLHHTSPYITGTTGSEYYLNITANTISNDIVFNPCDINCNSIEQSIVNLYINASSTGTSSSFGTNRTFSNGMYYTNPIYFVAGLVSANTPNTISSFNNGYFITPDWAFNTYPFSGNPSTIIPSLSGSVCNFNNTGVRENIYNSYNIKQYKYLYQVRLSNPSNVNDFDIWASPINNFSYSGAPSTVHYELAYRYSGGNVTYSSSTYII